MEAIIGCIPFLLVFMGLDWLRNSGWNVEDESIEAHFKNEKDFE